MAIPADTVWEVRPTNGDNTFGGGFSDANKGATGVDYSQQNTSALDITDLACAGGTAVVTSAAAGFTNLMLGNVLRINNRGTGNHFNLGFYVIVGFTSSTQVTLDRDPTDGSAGVDGQGKVGGATKSFTAQTMTSLQASLVAGNTVYVKNEAWNEAVTVSVAGASTTPITIEGYGTVRGDGTAAANRPVNDKANSGVPFTFSQAYYIIKHLKATRAATIGFNVTGARCQLINCASYSNGSTGFTTTSNNLFIGCESYSNTTIGFNLTSGPTVFIGCNSHDNTTTGYTLASTGSLFYCIADTNGSHGISDTGGVITSVVNCTLYGNGGDGFNSSASSTQHLLINNIFASNTGNGLACGVGTQKDFYADYNCVHGNGTAYSNFVAGANDTTVNPTFTNAGAGDLGVGVNLKAIGFPSVFPGATSTGYVDMGAVQRQEAGGNYRLLRGKVYSQ